MGRHPIRSALTVRRRRSGLSRRLLAVVVVPVIRTRRRRVRRDVTAVRVAGQETRATVCLITVGQQRPVRAATAARTALLVARRRIRVAAEAASRLSVGHRHLLVLPGLVVPGRRGLTVQHMRVVVAGQRICLVHPVPVVPVVVGRPGT